MLRIPGLPFLPGTVFTDISKQYFPRVQKLMTYHGLNMISDRKPLELLDDFGVTVDPTLPPYTLPSLYPPKTGPKLPTWLAYDRKVLRFTAYFKSTLIEVYKAKEQIRTVKILYYLEDGTMQVSEPRVRNSGLMQGCLLSRRRVPKPPPCNKEFYSILDLNVDSTVNIFDKVYHIVSCDLFTRHFLNRAGIHVPDPVPIPEDPSLKERARAMEKPPNAKGPDLSFVQFLKHDGKVLMFNAYWDDKSEFGDIRRLEVLYFLGDDTMEVREIFPVNSGRDAPQIFLKRQKLTKNFTGMPLPGAETKKTTLNVLSNNRYVVDSLDIGARNVNYYKDNDLQIGVHLNIYGRDVVLTSCGDNYTKEYYRKKYGIEDFTPIKDLSDEYFQTKSEPKIRELPPFNGWGSHESSEGNCISVLPPHPHPDFHKAMKYDRLLLRFGAKMLSKIKENCERMFVITYYMSDDTLSIYEKVARNSGFLGGEFFKRARFLLPNQTLLTPKPPNYYRSEHFFIGSTVNLKDHLFHIVTADEYTIFYMENHPEKYPMADVKLILNKIREAIRPDYKNFIQTHLPQTIDSVGDDANCYIDFATIRKALVAVLDKNISEHEIITLCRHLTVKRVPEPRCKRERVRAATHLEFKRSLWDAMDRLKEHIYHIAPDTNGFMSRTTLESVIRAVRLPITKELMEDIFDVLNRNKCGEVEICDFINFIDMYKCPAPAFVPVSIPFQLCSRSIDVYRGTLIHWKQFLDELGLEEQLQQETE